VRAVQVVPSVDDEILSYAIKCSGGIAKWNQLSQEQQQHKIDIAGEFV
jgi:hypothetical protein